MGIYRCNQCGTMAEYAYMPGMEAVSCVKCLKPVKVFDTVFFIKRIINRYQQQHSEVKKLTQQLEELKQQLKQLTINTVPAVSNMSTDCAKDNQTPDRNYALLQPPVAKHGFSYPLRVAGNDYESIFLVYDGLWFKVMRSKLVY